MKNSRNISKSTCSQKRSVGKAKDHHWLEEINRQPMSNSSSSPSFSMSAPRSDNRRASRLSKFIKKYGLKQPYPCGVLIMANNEYKVCNESFNSRQDYNKHMRNVHTDKSCEEKGMVYR